MKLTWKERIFSLKWVDATHRQLCVLGVRIKLRRKNQYAKLHHELQNAKLCHELPIEPRKVVLHSCFGAYQCSPKYIAEEFRRRGTNCDLVWVVEKNILYHIKSFPDNVRLVMRDTPEAMRELATARVWIENERKLKEIKKGLRKRQGQVYINTWHGSLGIKKTGGQRHDLTHRDKRVLHADDAQLDYLISNSAYTTAFYRDVFYSPHAKIVELGCPRNDIFFLPAEQKQAIRCKVCSALGLDPIGRILLWAPTFRENGDTSVLSLDASGIADALTTRFGGKWSCVARMHHHILRDSVTASMHGWLDASRYSDMQELLVTADAVITDYSSCIYDFLLTRQPGFLYAPDYNDYKLRRGLCYPLEATPFPIAETSEQLIQTIRSFDEPSYRDRVESFLRGKRSIDDGHASARVADLIESILDAKEVRT